MEAFAPRITNHKKYFEVVSGSNEAFFVLPDKISSHCLLGKKSFTDARAEDPMEPELARDKPDNIEDDEKKDDGKMATADAVDAANFFNKKEKIQYKI